MATAIQRLQMIGDAFLNRTATQGELTRLSDAIGEKTLGAAYAGLTNNQKALHAVQYLRSHVIDLRKSLDGSAAAAAAMASAASAVDTEFQET